MGEVWRAYDRFLDRRVAVKFTRVMDESLVERFEQEARSTAWFEHPGVPTVYDFGSHDGCFYLVMQYVEGMTVDHVLDAQERLPVSWAALIAAQVCAVLNVAHRRPLVHRDLKPSNLMLCPDGSVKVLDFGATTSGDESAPPDRTPACLHCEIPMFHMPGLSGPAPTSWPDGCRTDERRPL
ncbi:serine/threonine-protein kinase [Actinomadura sp. 3N508]|uniref:serine/threonine-protein kinase n=1 Tax=Actinomadura sp. 3N508 TaxID=3375153 RepID=UPI0037A03B86